MGNSPQNFPLSQEVACHYIVNTLYSNCIAFMLHCSYKYTHILPLPLPTMPATIQVRTDAKLKKDAQKVLEEMGLDLSSAINVYLRQIVFTGSIPFPLRTVNGFTPEQEDQVLREADEAVRKGKRYSSAAEMHRDILAE